MANSLFNPSQRRPSLYKPSLLIEKIQQLSLNKFVLKDKTGQGLKQNAPFTWERLACGCRIIDLQIDRMEEMFDFLTMYFFYSNGSQMATSLYIDSHTIHSYQNFILDIAADHSSLCAIEEGTNKIVGVAMISRNETNPDIEESMEDCEYEYYNNTFNLLQCERDLLNDANINMAYKVDKYLCIHIICIHPKYYGKGIGTSLIRSFLTKAQKEQYPLCIGIFPGGPSCTIAQKFDFQPLSEIPLEHVILETFDNHNVYTPHSQKNFITCMGTLVALNDSDNMSSAA